MPAESELTRFQLDILTILADADADGGTYGLEVKDRLEDRYGVTVNHGRLYPNLDDLADQGLVSKREIDKRTNGYKLTARGVRELADRLQFLRSNLLTSFVVDEADGDELTLRDR